MANLRFAALRWRNWEYSGLGMHLGVLSVTISVIVALATLAAPVHAQDGDPEIGGFFERLFGGFDSGSGPIPRRRVSFDARYKPGTIVIKTNERRLYLVTGEGEALRYGIGVGRRGFAWRGTHRVSAKKEWPGWTPPPQMLRRQPYLPRYMPGGVSNPLGARALYLGSTLYRIHGSNEPDTIGTAVSSGCFRLTNDDVIHLYNRVKVGALVVVQ